MRRRIMDFARQPARWTIAVLCITGFSAAHGTESGRLMARFSAEARALEARENARDVREDLGLLREWLGEAQTYMRQEEDEALRNTLRRVRSQVRLVQALLDRTDTRIAAVRAYEAADAKEREAAAARTEAFALERRLAALDSEAKPMVAP